MSRKALIVGIDYYQSLTKLRGCVKDAKAVAKILEKNADGGGNFGVSSMTADNEAHGIVRDDVADAITDLFTGRHDIALFYFAGHGYADLTGGYLCTSECRRGSNGVPLANILKFAAGSPSTNKIILLDSCQSGAAGQNALAQDFSELSTGMTILAAATADQYALEGSGHGLFTSLLLDALGGAAANLVGDVTPGSIYAHIDQSLGEWAQRPVFKANVQNFVSLRRTAPALTTADLLRLTEFFKTAESEVNLDATFERELTGRYVGAPPPNEENCKKFDVLQRFNRVNVVVPLGASKPNMWHAAMENKSCGLTPLGQHYWRLVKQNLIRT